MFKKTIFLLCALATTSAMAAPAPADDAKAKVISAAESVGYTLEISGKCHLQKQVLEKFATKVTSKFAEANKKLSAPLVSEDFLNAMHLGVIAANEKYPGTPSKQVCAHTLQQVKAVIAK